MRMRGRGRLLELLLGEEGRGFRPLLVRLPRVGSGARVGAAAEDTEGVALIVEELNSEMGLPECESRAQPTRKEAMLVTAIHTRMLDLTNFIIDSLERGLIVTAPQHDLPVTGDANHAALL